MEYSESTAYKLMRIAEEYGPGLSSVADSGATTFGVSATTEPFAKLGYTQALILLGLPPEERAEFITQFDLENTAVRELKQAVTDRKLALAEKEALQKERDAQKSTISKLSNELDQANKEAHDKQQAGIIVKKSNLLWGSIFSALGYKLLQWDHHDMAGMKYALR